MERLSAGLSDPGLVRTTNQDAYYIDQDGGRFFVVADGMGGHAGGQEASAIATAAIREHLESFWQPELDPEMLLKEALTKANHHILENQREFPERSDMGTTAVVVIFPEGQPAWCAHVGDSRLYRFRENQLEQLTEDHTWIAQAVSAGMLEPEQARQHPWRHVLAQCLGRDDLARIDVQAIDIQAGDRLLLCSDGLTEELSDVQISEILEAQFSCDESTAQLVEAAKQEGGQDNITVILVEQTSSEPLEAA
jgi:PPM family protein phosphatase